MVHAHFFTTHTKESIMSYAEPTELEMALLDRYCVLGQQFVGPLTRAQQDTVDSYEAWCAEQAAEHEAEMRAGGRTVCDECGQRKVVHRTVCTYGRPGVEGSDYSDYGKCENCGHEELAG